MRQMLVTCAVGLLFGGSAWAAEGQDYPLPPHHFVSPIPPPYVVSPAVRQYARWLLTFDGMEQMLFEEIKDQLRAESPELSEARVEELAAMLVVQDKIDDPTGAWKHKIRQADLPPPPVIIQVPTPPVILPPPPVIIQVPTPPVILPPVVLPYPRSSRWSDSHADGFYDPPMVAIPFPVTCRSMWLGPNGPGGFLYTTCE